MMSNVNIQDCKTVCLTLGPYRNLTTLTAATLFLHPNCQVLNHAGSRILENDDIDFLSCYSKDKFNRFIEYAIQISGSGGRGDFGGSITKSHAFDAHHEMKNIFIESGQKLIKTKTDCLFWKESLSTSNMIKEKQIDLGLILEAEERLRFFMPIRNPMDCAISNLKTGHFKRFRGLNENATIHEVLQAILTEIHWFASYMEKFPSRFFYYHEYSISREMLLGLASFLRLSPDETWLSNAQSVLVIKSSYQHNSQLLEFYQESVVKQFARFPVLKEQLLIYAQDKE